MQYPPALPQAGELLARGLKKEKITTLVVSGWSRLDNPSFTFNFTLNFCNFVNSHLQNLYKYQIVKEGL